METTRTSPLRLLILLVCALMLAGAAGCDWSEGPLPPDDGTPDDVTPDDVTPDEVTPDDGTPDDGTPDVIPDPLGDIEIPDFGDPSAPLFTDAALSPDGRYLVLLRKEYNNRIVLASPTLYYIPGVCKSFIQPLHSIA